MAVSTSVGPVSGIDYGTLISGLMSIEQQPLNLVQKQMTKVKSQSDGLLSLSAILANLKLSATNFSSSAVFRSTSATSSNTSVMSATSSIGAPVGSYSFNVQRLAAATQLATQGFSSSTTAIGSLGTIPLSADSTKLAQVMKLSSLNGGAGVTAGSINITTKDGTSTTVDLSSATTVQDVVDKINTAMNKSGTQTLSAAIKGDKFILTDNTGGTGTLSVTNTGSTNTATGLGLAQASAVGNTLTSGDVNRLTSTTALSQLNNGNGVRTNGSTTAADFIVSTTTNGVATTYNVNLSGATTVGDVIKRINTAGTKDNVVHLTATLAADGHSIQITGDTGSTISVAANGTSMAARDLGLTSPVTSGGQTITGERINSSLSSVLLRELNSGSGVSKSKILLTNRSGTSTTVDLASANTVQDVLDLINAQTGTSKISAALNTNSNGIDITDSSGGTGTLSVSSIGGTAANDLGILTSVSASTINGSDLKLRALGSGTMTFMLGRGAMDEVAQLSDLNGGKGVSKGSIRITDRSGATSTVDLSKAIDLNDVVSAINSAGNINVVASIGGTHGDQLVLKDQSGGSGTLGVVNVGTSTTATDLGLAGGTLSSDKTQLTGTDLNKLSLTTSLDLLNNKNGVRILGSTQDDLQLNYTGGSVSVSLSGAKTLSDVLSKINTAANVNGSQKVTAALSSDGHGITLTAADAGSGGTVSVTALHSSNAARDLGLLGTATNGVLTGSRIVNATNSPLLSELNGGSGIRLGTMSITNHSGVASSVDLSSAQTLNDVISAINTQATGVTAALNSAKNGIVLTDTTGLSTGTLAVSGNAATDLGLAQTTTSSTMNSKDLHMRVMSDNTLLSSLNGGAGFVAGKIKLTDSLGNTSTVDLSDSSITTLGQVIAKINGNSTKITASVNANGNGLLLTDSSTGSQTAKVEEVGTTSTAASLNILGSFSGGKLDGSFQKTITILGTDTLSDIATKITSANVGVAASVINDGSGTNPFRLNITSRSSGSAGRLNFDASSLGISTTLLVAGQDAVVTYGGTSTTAGLTATSKSNTIASLVPGLTLNLNSVGTSTVTVARDDSKISDSIQTFVDNYNKAITTMATLTKFDASNNANNGVLFGNSTVANIQQSLGSFISRTFSGVGSITNLGTIGISINEDATLSLNTTTLQNELSSNPDDVRTLFTAKTDTSHTSYGGVGAILSNLADQFTDSTSGSIFRATDALATQTTQLQERSNYLNDLLTAKKNRLIKTYANLEVTIAKLQSQSSALSSFTGTKSSSSSSTSSSS